MVNFQQRIQLALPPWWGTAHPKLDSVVAGYAAGLQGVADQITALLPFLRLNTATGELVDIAAIDFFGNDIVRQSVESDAVFIARIKANLFVIKGVRWAFAAQVNTLTSSPPTIIDPRCPADTGVMGSVATGAVPTVFCATVRHDCITSFHIPYQWFVRITGHNSLYNRNGVFAQIAALMPAGTVCWTKLAIDATGVYYRNVAVTYMGQRVTYGAT